MEQSAFRTPTGTTVPAITAAEMREVDRVATEEFGVDLLQLMENAGRALARHVREAGEGRPVVLAGGGGNGGGGLAAARHLANRGASVDVVLDRPAAELSGAAARQHAILDAMDLSVRVGVDGLATSDADTLVDALIGYGLDGPPAGTAADLIEAADGRDGPVVSLDVPSGVDATTGEAPGPAVSPTALLTLALPKTGLVAVECECYLADISVPDGVYDALEIPYEQPYGAGDRVAIRPVDPGS